MADEKRDIVIALRFDTKDAEGNAKSVENNLKGVEDALKKIGSTKDTAKLGKEMQELNAIVKNQNLTWGEAGKTIEQYQNIALAAGSTSPIGQEAIRRAGELKQEVDVLSRSIDNAAQRGQALQGALAIGTTVTAGYGALQGVMALAGQENEALMQSLVKMQAAQSVLTGIEQIRLAVEKEGVLVTTIQNTQTKIATALTAAYATVVGTATGAMKIFKLALVATGIGAIVVGLGLLIANFDLVSEVVTKTSKRVYDFVRSIKDMSTEMQVLIGFLTFGIVPAFNFLIDTLEEMGVVDDEETKKMNANAKAKRDAIKNATNEIISDLNRQSEANRNATDDAINNLDYEIKKRQAAGEQTKDLEREKILLLINSTKTELALIQQRIDAKQNEIDKSIGYNKVLAEITKEKDEAIFKSQKETLDKLVQDLEIFDIGERKRAMDEIARKKETSSKKTEIVKEEISEEDKLRDAALEREKKRQLDQIAAEEKATDEYNKRQLDARQTELQALTDRYFAEQEAFRDNKEMLALIEEEFLINEAALKKKYADEDADKKKKSDQEDLERSIALEDAKLSLASEGLNVAGQLVDAFQGNSEKAAKRAFQIQKGISIAQATIDTYKGATAIFASAAANPTSILFPAQPFITAGLAIGAGLANVAKISRQQFNGGGGGGSTSVSIPRVSSGGANGGASGQNQQNDNLTNIASLLNNQPSPVLVVDSFNKVNNEASKIKTVSSI